MPLRDKTWRKSAWRICFEFGTADQVNADEEFEHKVLFSYDEVNI
jgi:hypothetical protein